MNTINKRYGKVFHVKFPKKIHAIPSNNQINKYKNCNLYYFKLMVNHKEYSKVICFIM